MIAPASLLPRCDRPSRPFLSVELVVAVRRAPSLVSIDLSFSPPDVRAVHSNTVDRAEHPAEAQR